jgi:PTH1 family peptidyl-tRNA hydrolase
MLVVGLGNPGARYSGSPHNVGFRVLDWFAERLHAERPRVAWTERFEAELALGQLDACELVLLKPLTFMNRSGTSVKKAMSFFEIPLSDALVVHDELDLPFGSVKLKRGGGEAGHHGLESVSAELGSRDYARCRVGVGKPAEGPLVDYLLTPLPALRQAELEATVEQARQAIELVAREGLERAMNQVNRQQLGGSPSEAGRPD